MSELNPIEWAVLPLRKYADFSGRAPRAEYWWFYLGTIVVQIPLSIADEVFGTWSPLSTLFSVATLIPWLAVTVRRLHDTNRSGWWLLALFLPLIVVAVAAAAAVGASLGGPGSGPGGPMLVTMIVAIIAMLVIGITLFVFMVSEGTAGPNDYGDDPYGPDSLEEVFA
ncbi:MAG: DUF805 domain-containing protein [Sphingomicrobium sp.]